MYELPVVLAAVAAAAAAPAPATCQGRASVQDLVTSSSFSTVPMVPPGARAAGPAAPAWWEGGPGTMKVPHCSCCFSHLLASALLLLLLLPGLGGPLALLLQAAEAAPDPGPPDRGLRTLPPPPPGPTAAQSLGGAPAEAAGPRDAEGGNGSSTRAGLSADDSGGKAGEEDSVGGSLAVSPNPSDKPMTQRALTVLMVVSGAVLVYFVVRTVRWGEASMSFPCRPEMGCLVT